MPDISKIHDTEQKVQLHLMDQLRERGYVLLSPDDSAELAEALELFDADTDRSGPLAEVVHRLLL